MPSPDEWDDGDGAAGGTVWRVIRVCLFGMCITINVHQ